MRLQATQPALLQALRCQQQVDAERAPDPTDLHEHVDEVRTGGQQLTELVTNDQKAGQRLQRHAGGPRPFVVALRGVVTSLTKQLLATHEFALNGAEHAVHKGQLIGQVGDDGAGMRQAVERGERGAALEVDEDEVEDLGVVGHRERQHQGAQQLALSGAGGADEQAVRAHAVLRRLLEVQFYRATVEADADRYPQPVAVGPAGPDLHQIELVGIIDAEQGSQSQIRGYGRLVRNDVPDRRSGASSRTRTSASIESSTSA
jgi:hypothetical protein